MSEATVPYESTEDPRFLPDHLERVASRDYVAVNEGFWILRDAAASLRTMRETLQKIADEFENINVKHQHFRVWAKLVAEEALEKRPAP